MHAGVSTSQIGPPNRWFPGRRLETQSGGNDIGTYVFRHGIFCGEDIMKTSGLGLSGLVLFVSCLVLVPIVSGEGVSNAFSPGTAAQSGQVKQNFDFENYGNVVVKANGVVIGSFLSRVVNSYVPLYDWIMLMNPQGYIICVDGVYGTIGLRYVGFTTFNCTGTPHIVPMGNNHSITTFNSPVLPGEVINTGAGLYYLSRNPGSPIKVNSIQSLLYKGNCSASGIGFGQAYALTPNDPSVTGVSSATYPLPITIERR